MTEGTFKIPQNYEVRAHCGFWRYFKRVLSSVELWGEHTHDFGVGEGRGFVVFFLN